MALLWTQKQDVGPTSRIFPAMTFDASRERVVLFGGQVAGGVNTADTWSWDGADWTQISDMGPSARAGGAMAFDAICERVVLFGGTSIAGAIDTWEWDGAEWTLQVRLRHETGEWAPEPSGDAPSWSVRVTTTGEAARNVRH